MSKIYDVIILGAGPAGLAAGLYAGRARLSTLVLEKGQYGGQIATTSEIENYPGQQVESESGSFLAARMAAQMQRFGAERVSDTIRCVELTGNVKKLTGTRGTYLAKTVILATGAFPRELGLPDEQALRGRGVAYCAACDGMLYRGKTVVVNGGGNTAVGDALYLAKLCKKVYLVHRRDELRASAVYRDALRENGVEILWNSRITALRKEKRLTGVEVEDLRTGARRELFCDGLFVAIGRVPDTALFAGQVELDPSGYIVADETTRTSVPGVFAVGDARTKAVRQIVTAVADGAVAAHYAEEFLLEDAVKDKNLS